MHTASRSSLVCTHRGPKHALLWPAGLHDIAMFCHGMSLCGELMYSPVFLCRRSKHRLRFPR